MIDAINVNRSNYSSNVAFKGQNDSKDSTQVTNRNTHYGLKTGGVMSSIVLIGTVCTCIKTKKFAGKDLLNLFKNVAMHLGCGAGVDFIINKNKNAFNEKVKTEDKKNLKNADVTPNGNIYYNSNDGKKWGSLLGAGMGVITALTTKNPRLNGKFAKLFDVAISSLGGLMLGSITDKLTNKRSSKDVDTNA